MTELDLVISIDTAAAHLAGAMGRPLWLLLAPGQCDYRWNGTDGMSPWYPAARLFRAGDACFAALAGEVARALEPDDFIRNSQTASGSEERSDDPESAGARPPLERDDV